MNICNYINIKIVIIILLCCIVPHTVHARTRVTAVTSVKPLTWECLSAVATRYELPVAILLGVLATEGGQPGQAVSNTNGTWDLGPFQINTCHVKQIADAGVSPALLLTDSCVNAAVAGWILRKERNRSRDIWEAVGAYHSRTPARHKFYIRSVQQNLAELRDVGRLLDYANGRRRSWK